MIKDLKVIKQDWFQDERGSISSLYHYERTPAELGIYMSFEEEKISCSNRNVLRGLHGDKQTWKLITCLRGMFELAVVDCRRSSNTYAEVNTFLLSPETNDTRLQVLVPPGCANGHYCIDDSILYYKWSHAYSGATNQFTIKYDDEDLAIGWQGRNGYNIILSERDRNGVPFREIQIP